VLSGDVDEALGRLGCRAAVVSLDPHSLDEVMIDIQNVGRAAAGSAPTPIRGLGLSLRSG
jgi:iron complex transport system substrate-binding protein